MGAGVRLGALAVGLLAAYLSVPFLVRGFRFPVGADATVYLWWISLVHHDGLSAVGARAGIPAVVLILSGALGITPVTLLAGLQCALGTTVGVTSTALVMPASGHVDRRVVLVGLTSGLFCVSIAAGYFSTLGFVALFLAAAASLGFATSRATVIAAALLGAAGLTHPLFLPLAVAVLASVAVLSSRAGAQAEATRIGAAVAGGVGLTAVGGLALMAGPAPLVVDTSRDGFLRRAGMSGLLHVLYVHRVFLHFWDYALFASVPLAILGAFGPEGYLRRLLWAWACVSVAAVTVGAATGWFPPERVLSIAFVLPILAAFGIERLLVRRTAATIVLASLGAFAMVGAAGWTWWHTVPPVSTEEAAAATVAGGFAAATPPGAPLVFEVAVPQRILTFYATRTANAIRAAVPPDRVRDVYVVVPPAPADADAERRALTTRYQEDVAAAASRTGLKPTIFRADAFAHDLFPASAPGVEVAPGLHVADGPTQPAPQQPSPLLPTSPWKIGVAAALVLVLLTLVGSGWARLVANGGAVAAALSPAIGLGALVLVGVALERLGLPLDRAWSARPVLVLTAATGWTVDVAMRRHVAARRSRTSSPSTR
ncbi:MAG: hypothetical protein ACXVPX_02665 [Actinomycetota bacterium]